MLEKKKAKKRTRKELGKTARALKALESTTALVPVSQAVVVAKPWKWSPVKRQAVEMLCTGGKRTTVAKVLGIGRKTLYRWLQQPEFNAGIQDWVQDLHRVRKGKRIRNIGVLSDTVQGLITSAITHMHEEQQKLNLAAKKGQGGGVHTLSKDGIAQLSMLLRENRELYAQEREDFGENNQPRRVEGNIQHTYMGIPGMITGTEQQVQQQVADSEQSKPFSEWVEKHGDPAFLKSPVGDPLQSLVTVARNLVVNNPEVIAEIIEEDERRAEKKA